jgi:hypothetical protein
MQSNAPTVRPRQSQLASLATNTTQARYHIASPFLALASNNEHSGGASATTGPCASDSKVSLTLGRLAPRRVAEIAPPPSSSTTPALRQAGQESEQFENSGPLRLLMHKVRRKQATPRQC